ncbi:rhomboid family intramembrane serine protease [Caldibacillus kokeshiiformis]|jgi:rhomboid protease GluP|nr:rhomboid family intramembrane serine protease [Pallidibacillus thermolactis subsp. kokeshiiformis]
MDRPTCNDRIYMKVGKRLTNREDYLYWKLIHSLFIDGYRILNISEDQTEIWLENFSHRKLPIIRIKRKDIDWANWIKQDIKRTCMNGEMIRKRFLKRNLTCLNIYISTYPPVDSYQDLFTRSFQIDKTKTVVRNILFTGRHLMDSIFQITNLYGKDLFGSIKQEYDLYEVDLIRRDCLALFHGAEKKEKQLLNRTNPFFTYLFLSIQLLVFFLMELAGGSLNPNVLISFGAKSNEYIIEGEWWRFITPMFIHIGFIHLLFNSLALYYLGSMVERIYGKARFFIIYLLAGFLGTVSSFIFNYHISAGASGAIFGLFGALLYFGLVHKRTFFRTIGVNIIGLIVINLVLGFVIPGIDNAGHIGGLIGGFLAAGIVHLPQNQSSHQRFLFIVITFLLITGCLYYGYTYPKLLY